MRKKAVLIFLISIFSAELVACITPSNQEESAQNSENFSAADTTEETTQAVETTTTAILQKTDLDQKKVFLKEIGSGISTSLTYSGATDIKNKYGKEVTISQIESGEIVTVTYREEEEKLISLQVDAQAWEYTSLKDFSFDRTNKTMMISGVKYQYGSDLSILSNGEEIDMINLKEDMDILTVRGYSKRVYSIGVTQGHGYLTLENEDDLIGGWLEVDLDIAKPISEEMLLAVSEGDHKITVANNGIGGTKSITITRGEILSVDVGDFKAAAVKSGSIQFHITPDTAKLFINGEETAYDEVVTLTYGNYRIEVTADGYTSYASTVVLGSSFSEITIDLEEGTSSTTESSSTIDSQSSNDTVNTGEESITEIPSLSSTEISDTSEDDGSELNLDSFLDALTGSY